MLPEDRKPTEEEVLTLLKLNTEIVYSPIFGEYECIRKFFAIKERLGKMGIHDQDNQKIVNAM